MNPRHKQVQHKNKNLQVHERVRDSHTEAGINRERKGEMCVACILHTCLTSKSRTHWTKLRSKGYRLFPSVPCEGTLGVPGVGDTVRFSVHHRVESLSWQPHDSRSTRKWMERRRWRRIRKTADRATWSCSRLAHFNERRGMKRRRVRGSERRKVEV